MEGKKTVIDNTQQAIASNKLLCRSLYHYRLNVIQKDCLKVEKQFHLNNHELHFCTSFDLVPPTKTCRNISIRMVIKTSIDFQWLIKRGGCERFSEFASRNVKHFLYECPPSLLSIMLCEVTDLPMDVPYYTKTHLLLHAGFTRRFHNVPEIPLSIDIPHQEAL